MTGAPAPPGADAVVMVEHTARDGSTGPDHEAGGRGRQHRRHRPPKRSAASACCLRERGSTTPRLRWPRRWAEAACWSTANRKWRSSPPATKSWTSTFLPAATPDSQLEYLFPGRASAGRRRRARPAADRARRTRAPARTHRRRPGIRSAAAGGRSLDGQVRSGRSRSWRNSSAEFFFTGALIQPGKPVVFGRVPCGRGRPARECRHLPQPTFISSDCPAIQFRPW